MHCRYTSDLRYYLHARLLGHRQNILQNCAGTSLTFLPGSAVSDLLAAERFFQNWHLFRNHVIVDLQNSQKTKGTYYAKSDSFSLFHTQLPAPVSGLYRVDRPCPLGASQPVFAPPIQLQKSLRRSAGTNGPGELHASAASSAILCYNRTGQAVPPRLPPPFISMSRHSGDWVLCATASRPVE